MGNILAEDKRIGNLETRKIANSGHLRNFHTLIAMQLSYLLISACFPASVSGASSK